MQYGAEMSTNFATLERHALADLMAGLGPDVPTLCEGWTTRDLAAHLIVRESRPDAALGILASPFAAYGERIRKEVATRNYEDLVDQVRNGPPIWSPTKLGPIDKLVNTVEFFVHHEDVLRAQPGYTPRAIPAAAQAQLTAAIKRMARLFLRKAPCGVTLSIEGESPFVAKQRDPMVTVAGPAEEVLMFMEGRQLHSRCELSGPATAVMALKNASFGI